MERWVEEIEDWETRSVDDGYRGLQSLASEEFSGAISVGGTWLFMIKGRGVGVFEYRQQPDNVEVVRGDIERFKNADLTAHVSPHPAIPMLVTMQAGETETRGRYYTEDTPIREVHETLQDGGFTGYLELSENVLSGDYYIVYQGGRSMEVAYIGSSRRIETDDEAFNRAAGEVGIYEVVSAELQPIDIPEPEKEGGVATGAAGTSVDASSGAETTDDTGQSDGSESSPDPGGDTSAAEGDTSQSTGDDTTDETGETPVASGEDTTATSGETALTDSRSTDTSSATSDETSATIETTPDPEDDEIVDAPPTGTETQEPTAGATNQSTQTDAGTDQDPLRDQNVSEASGGAGGTLVDREVPSLDPERSGVGTSDGTREAANSRESPETVDRNHTDAGRGRTSDLEGRLADRESELEEMRAELEEARADLNRVRSERDELRHRVTELESELEDLRATVGDAGTQATGESATGADASQGTGASGGESLSPAQALAGTNLFVRYRSKGKTTLDDVHDGADPDTLADNLRLEHHTEFEDKTATVAGGPFEAWLHDSGRFRFLRWLTTTLPFEIRDTGATEELAALYDALPEVDRVELQGSIEVETEDGPREFDFDTVVRDRMGEPLAVARFETSREPVTETQLAKLVKSATAVAEREDTLASAFFVTESYFDPDALETAREATSGSLLSRDKRRSFVKLTRKQGYHLCLVESRDEGFHLSVPDL